MSKHQTTDAEFLDDVADGKSLTGADRTRLRAIANAHETILRQLDEMTAQLSTTEELVAEKEASILLIAEGFEQVTAERNELKAQADALAKDMSLVLKGAKEFGQCPCCRATYTIFNFDPTSTQAIHAIDCVIGKHEALSAMEAEK